MKSLVPYTPDRTCRILSKSVRIVSYPRKSSVVVSSEAAAAVRTTESELLSSKSAAPPSTGARDERTRPASRHSDDYRRPAATAIKNNVSRKSDKNEGGVQSAMTTSSSLFADYECEDSVVVPTISVIDDADEDRDCDQLERPEVRVDPDSHRSNPDSMPDLQIVEDSATEENFKRRKKRSRLEARARWRMAYRKVRTQLAQGKLKRQAGICTSSISFPNSATFFSRAHRIRSSNAISLFSSSSHH